MRLPQPDTVPSVTGPEAPMPRPMLQACHETQVEAVVVTNILGICGTSSDILGIILIPRTIRTRSLQAGTVKAFQAGELRAEGHVTVQVIECGAQHRQCDGSALHRGKRDSELRKELPQTDHVRLVRCCAPSLAGSAHVWASFTSSHPCAPPSAMPLPSWLHPAHLQRTL
eukprot:2489578-Rhodomonas_salina.2